MKKIYIVTLSELIVKTGKLLLSDLIQFKDWINRIFPAINLNKIWRIAVLIAVCCSLIPTTIKAEYPDLSENYLKSGINSSFAGVILVSDPGTDLQTICKNSALKDIAYYVTNGAPGHPNITGLPAGITPFYMDSIVILTGKPTVSGNFTYTITTTGSSPVTATGRINVNEQTIALSSTTGTEAQTVCLNAPISNIVYSLSGTATGSTVTGLPPGVTGSIAGSTFTISGGITTPGIYHYQVTTSGTTCSATTINGSLAIRSYWIGGTSNDWNTASNWSDNLVPSKSYCSDVYVPAGAPNQALLTGPTNPITNLNILTGGSVTIGSAGSLKIGGSINKASTGIFDITSGTLELDGASQNIVGSLFVENTINNLIVSSGGTGLTISGGATDTLNITGTLSFGNINSDLTATDGHLTLKSTIANTANLAQVDPGNLITGNVTVERYINTAIGHNKSWQLVSANTTGQSIFNSWMESGNNSIQGYGVQLQDASGVANGFDATSPAPAMKYYNPTNESYFGIGNPTLTTLFNKQGYMLFVRGDRTVDGRIITAPNPTTLRSTGALLTGEQISVPASGGKYQTVGNPYASTVDLSKLGGFGAEELDGAITVWDPELGGIYGYGGFQTITASTGYLATPGTTNIYNTTTSYNQIQSGQGFFVHNSGTAPKAVKFTESAKINGSTVVTRVSLSKLKTLSTQLYAVVDGSPVLVDGNREVFDKKYSNKVDANDALKMRNPGENFGLMRNEKLLAVETRNYPGIYDTIYYNMSNLQKEQSYLLKFNPENMDKDIEAELIDNFLKTKTPVSLTTSTNVNIAIGSEPGNKPDRFMLVFKKAASVPVNFVSIVAYQKEANIAVEWKAANEISVKQFNVEKAEEHGNYKVVFTAQNNGTGIYSWIDQNATAGYNNYRVRSISIDGNSKVSDKVRVLIQGGIPSISVHPNPISNGEINLRLINQQVGVFGIKLFNSSGQNIFNKNINHVAGTSIEKINFDYKLDHGLYQLQVIKPDGKVNIIQILF